jgi:ADP-heptose:LPS heptosyltransferase
MDLGSLERAWRRAWMRVIGELSSGPRTATAPDWDARPWSVLYVRTQGIGDMILATGVLRAIAQSHPTIELDVLTTRTAAPVLDHNANVRRVHVLGSSLVERLATVRTLRRARYDVVIDGKITRGASFIRSPALTMALRAPYRIGVGGGNHHLVFNMCVAKFDRTRTHMLDGGAALATPFGVRLDEIDLRPQIFLSADESRAAHARWTHASAVHSTKGDRWLVNLSAREDWRRWPDDRWIALIAHLRAQRPSATIGVMGTDADWSSVQEVAQSSGAVAIAAPRLRDALALVGTSSAVITSNTSITHAASAFTVPTVLLLERGEETWSSWRTPSEIAYWSGDSVSALSLETAIAALDRMLATSELLSASPA